MNPDPTRRRGQWCWITERVPPENPVYDWQSREPVTSAMKSIYLEACLAHDNSDGSNDAISHEEAVILQYAASEILALRTALRGLLEISYRLGHCKDPGCMVCADSSARIEAAKAALPKL